MTHPNQRLATKHRSESIWLNQPRLIASSQDSRSLRPLIDSDTASRDYAYSEWDLNASRCGVALKLRTVRTARHKLTLELNSGAGELYDFVEDPNEMDNRFDDPVVQSVRAELTDMIRARPNDALKTSLTPVGMA